MSSRRAAHIPGELPAELASLDDLDAAPPPGTPTVRCNLDVLLAQRGMTLTELSRRTGITMANLSILKNNHARAVRMSTLAAICRELGVTPGDILGLGDG